MPYFQPLFETKIITINPISKSGNVIDKRHTNLKCCFIKVQHSIIPRAASVHTDEFVSHIFVF